MAEIWDFSITDSANVARWPENMPFSGVNDAGRADEGILARWYRDTDGSLTAGGSSNAFTLTSNRTISSLFNNILLAFTANHTITGPATLNLNGLGARDIKRFNGSDLAAGDILSGQPVVVLYKQAADDWLMLTAPAALVTNMFADFSENIPANPAANVGRLYAKDESGRTILAYRDNAGFETRILPGTVVDRVYVENATAVALSAAMPFDDTIPQITEGTEILSAGITLKKASNRVRARFTGWIDDSTRIVVALFRVGANDAIQATSFHGGSDARADSMALEFRARAGQRGAAHVHDQGRA